MFRSLLINFLLLISTSLACLPQNQPPPPISTTTTPRSSVSPIYKCGRAKTSLESISSGVSAKKGEWPWLASLCEKIPNKPDEFFCGASLINEWTLITAAHCFRERQIAPHQLKIILGRLDISDSSERHWISMTAAEIKMHEDFWRLDRTRSDSDIALIILDDPIFFTEYIQPICLPNLEYNIKYTDGVAVGYGKTHKDSQTQKFQFHNKLEIVNYESCKESDDDAVNVVSRENNFCAKTERIVACSGDGGGPFMVEKRGTYTLLGVVSHAFNSHCSSNDYLVFTDVSKFIDWIWSNFYQCKDGSRKIPWLKYCDGYVDCADGSDERKCVRGEITRTLTQKTYSSYFGRLTFCPYNHTSTDEEDFGISSTRDDKIGWFHVRENPKFRFLPINVFEKFPNLKKYWVTSCGVRKISKLNFKSLFKLESLDLKDNQIEWIDGDTFDDLRSLKDLDLSVNKLARIDENWLKNLVNLEELNLSSNQIKVLSGEIFYVTTKLEKIVLSFNEIERIVPEVFGNLLSLRFLDLSENRCIDERFGDDYWASPSLNASQFTEIENEIKGNCTN